MAAFLPNSKSMSLASESILTKRICVSPPVSAVFPAGAPSFRKKRLSCLSAVKVLPSDNIVRSSTGVVVGAGAVMS